MAREGGLWVTAAVLGIAATLGVSTHKTQEFPAPGVERSADKSAHPTAHLTKALDKEACSDLEKLIRAFMLVDEDAVVAPASCNMGGQPSKTQDIFLERLKKLQFVIAVLPDPLHTHFPLAFDRFTEAIQEAARDERFVYDSSWLPWQTEAGVYQTYADEKLAKDEKEKREDQPGLLLFRGAVHTTAAITEHDPFIGGLAVFVVAEEPTAGIHRAQFVNALRWIAALQPEQPFGNSVRILGPSFSGSIPSLAQLLAEQAPLLQKRAAADVRIFSGNVSSTVAVDWLQQRLQEKDLKPVQVKFRSFQNSNNVDLDRFCRYVFANGMEPSSVAIVSEDETAFGSEYNRGSPDESPCRPEKPGTAVANDSKVSEPKRGGPVYLYYPRDIASLRAAYQSQSIFSQGQGDAGQAGSRHTLQADIADPGGEDHDTIRSYSANQMAVSQEAALLDMVSIMRAHDTQFIVLRSSNPLDQLFLSHYFRMTYPRARIIIAGSDLLLSRETGLSGLSGIMTLTTYPLLPWGQDWTRHFTSSGLYPPKGDQDSRLRNRFHSHRIFTNQGAEGTYVALRFLLHPMLIGKDDVTEADATDAATRADGETDAKAGFVPSNCEPTLFTLPEYGEPSWVNKPREFPCAHPPTWLSVLGDGGFWPIAAMDFPTDLGKPGPQPIPDLNQTNKDGNRWNRSIHSIAFSGRALLTAGGDAFNSKQAWPEISTSMQLALLLSFVWACYHTLCCLRGSVTAKPAHRAHFVKPNTDSADHPGDLQIRQRNYDALMLLGTVLIVLVPILLAWGYGAMWVGGEPLSHPWAYRAFLPLVWMIAGFGLCANIWLGQFLVNPQVAIPNNARLWKRFELQLSLLRDSFKHAAHTWRVWQTFLLYCMLSVLLYWFVDFFLDTILNDANRIPTYLRAMDLTTGVSPLVPLVALVLGLYAWFWCALGGLALFNEDRPRLPTLASLEFTPPQGGAPISVLSMFSSEGIAEPLERRCSPFALGFVVPGVVIFLFLVLAGGSLFGWPPIRSLGSPWYSLLFCLWLALSMSTLLASAVQFVFVWLGLRNLLLFLDRLTMRRTFESFTGFSWGSVWKMGGGVLDVRYKLFSRQMETVNHLRESLLEWQTRRNAGQAGAMYANPCPDIEPQSSMPSVCDSIQALDDLGKKLFAFASWYSGYWNDSSRRYTPGLEEMQLWLAGFAGTMTSHLLLPAWREESGSPLLDRLDKGKDDKESKEKKDGTVVVPTHIRNAEELVGLVYMAFIQNILGRLRSLVLGMVWVFLSITIAIASYPFDPRPLLSSMVLGLFTVLALTVTIVYSQMHRDATLSRMTDTTPGELGVEFWMKLFGLGLGPALGVLAAVFPEFGGYLMSLLGPGLAALR